MKKPIIFISIIITIIVGLSIIQVVVSNSLSTTGIELAKIEEEIRLYKKQNGQLSEQVLTASSFENIASKAAQMGFVEEKTHVVLSNTLPIAAKP